MTNIAAPSPINTDAVVLSFPLFLSEAPVLFVGDAEGVTTLDAVVGVGALNTVVFA